MKKALAKKLYYNIIVLTIFTAFSVIFFTGLKEMVGPISSLNQSISLDPRCRLNAERED